jgi:hypothetical protein
VSDAEKILENRLRRTLARRGYHLQRIRRIDRLAVDYGRYRVYETAGDTLVAADLDLAGVDKLVAGLPAARSDRSPRRRRPTNS